MGINMPFHHHTLPSGLEVIGETNPAALSTAVAFWVRTGSRDETPEVSGVSHFLEHMVFKGTERRDSLAVNRDFSKIGADNNAWTSEENTVFHAAVLPEFLPQAVDVLADIMRPSLRGEDFDTEKTVILDEIVRYEVQPGWATYDQARRIYFGGHPLGNSVLGTTESITQLSRDQMAAYFAQRYVAPNIHVVAAGNFDFDRLVEMVGKATAQWPTGTVGRTERREVKGAGGLHVLTRPRDKVSQQYVLLMAPSPAADSPLRFAAGVLATAVGDYTGSRIYWGLIDPGLADEAGMGGDECDGAGAYFVSFNGSPENAEECYAITRQILEEVQKNGITEDELQQAKTKIASREVRAGERTQRRMLNVGKDWAYLRQYRSVDDELAALDAVTLQSVREVLDRYPLTEYTTVTLGPLEQFAGTAGK
jgi:predicted Zn-dependent peptidase